MKTPTVLLLLMTTLFTVVNAGTASANVSYLAPRPDIRTLLTVKDDAPVTPPVFKAVEMLAEAPRRRSVPKAFLLSLLVPGTGQFYSQSPGRGRFFVGTELAILASYLGFRLYSDWKEEDYQLFAAAHAGVDTRGKSETYFEDVSLYMSMEEYNRQQLHDYREDAELYSGADFWEWDSQTSRREFDSLYRASSNAADNSVIMTGLGLLNHLLSAVDAARTARLFNKKQASAAGPVRFTFKIKPSPGSSVVMIGLKKEF
jgi:hypothetical protein